MTLNFLERHSLKFREILEKVLDEPLPTRDISKISLTERIQADVFRSRMQVDTRFDGRILNLVLRNNGHEQDEVADEVIFVVRGYVVNKNLPPLGEELRRQPISASQSVEITGLGSEKFQESARNIILLHGVLHDSVPSGELLKSSQRRSSKGNLCLMFKTRYLTPHAELDADAPQVSPADLVEVDPYSVLEQYKNLGMHVVDNQVKYYDRVPNSQGTGWNYRRAKPTAIRVGHLVECQVSFSAVQLGGLHKRGRCNYQMLSKLRSICVLDRTAEEDEATSAALPRQVELKSSPRRLRRKIGYGENDSDNDEGNTDRLKRLRLNDEVDFDQMQAEKSCW